MHVISITESYSCLTDKKTYCETFEFGLTSIDELMCFKKHNYEEYFLVPQNIAYCDVTIVLLENLDREFRLISRHNNHLTDIQSAIPIFLLVNTDISLSFTKLPTCFCCLEKLDTSVSGLDSVESHSQSDLSCSVCRQLNKRTYKCGVCECEDDVWICMICGYNGCGRYSKLHARDHSLLSGHSLAMDARMGRIWDYSADVYVHRKLAQIHNDINIEIILPDHSEPWYSDDIDSTVGIFSHLGDDIYSWKTSLIQIYDKDRAFWNSKIETLCLTEEDYASSIFREIQYASRNYGNIKHELLLNDILLRSLKKSPSDSEHVQRLRKKRDFLCSSLPVIDTDEVNGVLFKLPITELPDTLKSRNYLKELQKKLKEKEELIEKMKKEMQDVELAKRMRDQETLRQRQLEEQKKAEADRKRREEEEVKRQMEEVARIQKRRGRMSSVLKVWDRNEVPLSFSELLESLNSIPENPQTNGWGIQELYVCNTLSDPPKFRLLCTELVSYWSKILDLRRTLPGNSRGFVLPAMLTTLDLTRCSVGWESICDSLIPVLHQIPPLTKLVLDENPLNIQVLPKLQHFFEQHLENRLVHLSLNSCGLHRDSTPDSTILLDFLNSLNLLPRLKVLRIADNILTFDSSFSNMKFSHLIILEAQGNYCLDKINFLSIHKNLLEYRQKRIASYREATLMFNDERQRRDYLSQVQLRVSSADIIETNRILRKKKQESIWEEIRRAEITRLEDERQLLITEADVRKSSGKKKGKKGKKSK